MGGQGALIGLGLIIFPGMIITDYTIQFGGSGQVAGTAGGPVWWLLAPIWIPTCMMAMATGIMLIVDYYRSTNRRKTRAKKENSKG